MIAFTVIYIIAILLVLITKRKALFIPIAFITVMAGMRGNVGYDTCNYKDLYSVIGSLSYDELSYIEPGFLLIASISKLITDEPQLFLFAMAVAQGVLLFLIAKMVKNPSVFLLIFIPVFYYSYFYSMVRQALATLILGYAYASYLNNGSRAYVSLLAPTIHFSVFPVLVIIKPVAKYLYLLTVVALILIVFKSDFLLEHNAYTHYGKLSAIFTGAYYLEQNVTWHVYLSYIVMEVVIVLTTNKYSEIIIYSILITLMMIADLYFYRTGRIANVAMTCLCILHSNRWRTYCPSVKIITVVYYCYLLLSMTVYPICYGDERVQGPFAPQVRTQAGNYHLWLFNDKGLCQY